MIKLDYKKIFQNIFTIIGVFSTFSVGIYAVIQIHDRLCKAKPVLEYKIEHHKIRDMMDDMQLANDYDFPFSDEYEEGNLEPMGFFDVELKNTGDRNLSYEDFYEYNTLQIKTDNDKDLYGVLIDEQRNLRYIHPKAYIESGRIYIIFEKLKPNDAIYIKVFTARNKIKHLKFSGTTKYFRVPIPANRTSVIMSQ